MHTKSSILIVDDDPGIRKTLSDILRVKGYTPNTVDSGQAALNFLELQIPVIALIDLKLDDMTGLELLEALKKRANEIECILLTGHATQKSAIEAVNLGAYGYMQKPYEVDQLLIMIQRAVEKQEAGLALRAYTQRLTTLREIDQAILEAQSSEAVAQAALEHIRYLMPFHWASVITFNLSSHQFTILAHQAHHDIHIEIDGQNRLETFPHLTKLAQGTIDLVDDISAVSDKTAFEDLLQVAGLQSYINIPLISQGDLIGTINLGAQQKASYTTKHIEVAQEVARSLAIALQQAHLNERIQDHAKQLEQHITQLELAQKAEREQRELAETLREVTAVLNTSLDREQVLRVILEQLLRVIEYDTASVMLVSDTNTLDTVARQSVHFAQAPLYSLNIDQLPHVQAVLTNQIPIIMADTETDPRWQNLAGTEYIRSWLGVPLVVQDWVIGLLNLNKQEANFYNDFDAELAAAFADRAAIAVANAQLFEQAQQEIAERIRAETALEAERASLAQRVEERTAELQAANDELAQASRLKDEFLANMSHELRTPLNAILGLSEALQEQVYGGITDKQEQTLNTIEESGRHLLALINDILDVSKIEAGKLTLHLGLVPIDMLCQASLRLIEQAAAKKDIEVIYSIDVETTTIYADQRRLKQILVNLLSNAVKFTPAGGQIGLEVTDNPVQQRILFTIWDTGIGISDEDLKQLFQPFVQLDSSLSRHHQGTGLGLALVHRLAELHNGNVTVDSESDRGSRFTVSLGYKTAGQINEEFNPLLLNNNNSPPPANVTTHQKSPPISVPPPKKRLVLLAEDNPNNIATVSVYLKAQGFEVAIANDGLEAVTQAKQLVPDIILMDIQMPSMSGLEAIKHIRQDSNLMTTPIIAITALAMPGDRNLCLQAGANNYLSKPLSLKELVKTINVELSKTVPIAKTQEG